MYGYPVLSFTTWVNVRMGDFWKGHIRLERKGYNLRLSRFRDLHDQDFSFHLEGLSSYDPETSRNSPSRRWWRGHWIPSLFVNTEYDIGCLLIYPKNLSSIRSDDVTGQCNRYRHTPTHTPRPSVSSHTRPNPSPRRQSSHDANVSRLPVGLGGRGIHRVEKVGRKRMFSKS